MGKEEWKRTPGSDVSSDQLEGPFGELGTPGEEAGVEQEST